MAIVQMQKVAILAMKAQKEEVIDTLQTASVVDIQTSVGSIAPVDHTDARFKTAEIAFAIDTLQKFSSKQTLAVAAKKATEEEIMHAATHTDVREIIDTLHALEEADSESLKEMNENTSRIAELSPWTTLPYNLGSTTETERTIRILGTVSQRVFPELELKLENEVERTEVELLSTDEKGVAHVCAYVWKEDMKQFEELVTTYGWSNITLPALEGTAGTLVEELKIRQKELESTIEKNNDTRRELSVELPNLIKVRTFTNWLSEKQVAREAMSETDRTTVLLGWVPKAKIDLLEDKLKRVSPATSILKVKPDEGEEPPVLLKNSKLVTPFESVTSLYGLPLASEGDPTAALSPFFILYFALCLTDAGYGAVIALIFGITLLKTKKTVEEAPLIWLLFFGGIMTFIVSIFFGGWFGLTPEQVPAIFTKTTETGELLFKGQIWNLNNETGISFLQNLSLVLGITHLSFGMFLAGYHKWVHGKKAEAFWVDFTVHILIASAIFYAVMGTDTALYILYGALALTVWGKGHGNGLLLRPLMGLLGLVNLGIGLLSNTLSYLRLLALGLVTGAIAMAINQVAVEMGKLFPIYIAIPVIIIISVGGHIVSIALNTLGSFIHSGRLQFIEFFSQFFEGGGRSFTPFKRSSI